MREMSRKAALEHLQAWTSELRAGLQDGLVSVIVYGSAAREDFDAAHSDVNLLIVVERADLTALRALAEPLQKARLRFRGAPFVMTREEILGSRDVFPIKFHEMSGSYEVVLGEDCLKDLKISYADLRHACETELRNMSMKLRRIYLAEAPDPRPLLSCLRRFTPQLLGVIRVLLEHQEPAGSTGSQDPAAAAASRFGFELDHLRWMQHLRREEHVPWTELEGTYGNLLNVLERLTLIVDRWTTP